MRCWSNFTQNTSNLLVKRPTACISPKEKSCTRNTTRSMCFDFFSSSSVFCVLLSSCCAVRLFLFCSLFIDAAAAAVVMHTKCVYACQIAHICTLYMPSASTPAFNPPKNIQRKLSTIERKRKRERKKAIRKKRAHTHTVFNKWQNF